jgi:Kef-type K+ transport system membrane component KefB
LLLGVVIGLHVLGLIELNPLLSFMCRVGTAVMLFMAGMEIDFRHIRGGSPRWRFAAGSPAVVVPIMIEVALTTTGPGTLLPGLRDGGLLNAPLGRLVLAAGAVGEVGPIVAVWLTLSERYSSWQEYSFLLVYLALVGATMAISVGVRPPAVVRPAAHPVVRQQKCGQGCCTHECGGCAHGSG